MLQYVIKDRLTGQNYALKISDTQFLYETTSDSDSPEPIFEDTVNAGTYWQIFIYDSEFAYEQVLTVQDDDINLFDYVTNSTFKLRVSDSQFNYLIVSSGGIRSLIAIRKLPYIKFVEKNIIDNSMKIVCFVDKNIVKSKIISKEIRNVLSERKSDISGAREFLGRKKYRKFRISNNINKPLTDKNVLSSNESNNVVKSQTVLNTIKHQENIEVKKSSIQKSTYKSRLIS